MAEYEIGAAPWQLHAPVLDLRALHGRKWTFKRGDAASFEAQIDGRHPDAEHLVDLVTDLHIRRDGIPFFRGRIALTGDALSEDTHDTKVTAGDYRAVLGRRFLFDNDILVSDELNGDVGYIAAALLYTTQSRPAGWLGITAGFSVPHAGRSIHELKFTAGQSIAQAIDVMADTDRTVSGFDWEVTPGLKLNIYPGRRGGNNGAVLEYGANVTKIDRTNDPASYANALRGNGANNAGIAITLVTDDLDSRPEGRWESQVGFTEVQSIPVLEGAVMRELDRRSVLRSSYKAVLKPGWWGGPGHLWLGDTARVIIQSGRLNVDEDVTVESISIDVSDDGDEQVVVELSEDFPGFIRRLASIEQRLGVLERN